MKRVIFAFILAVFAVGAAQADYVACTSCAKYDVFGGDAVCQLDLQDQCGSSYSSTCVFDEDSGDVYCDGVTGSGSTTTCTCPSGYSGTCTGTDYSTCYKSCTLSCTSYNTAECNEIVGSGGGYYDCSDTGWYYSSCGTGKQYYGESTCTGSCTCRFNALGCGGMNCPSGYAVDDEGYTYFNTCKDGDIEANCYKSCSGTVCSGNDTASCPSNATCTYNTSFSYEGQQYYGGSCNAGAAGKCPVSSITCAANYYLSGSSCVRCPQHSSSGAYGSSSAGSVTPTSCYIGTGTSWTFSDTKGSGSQKFTSTCYYSN